MKNNKINFYPDSTCGSSIHIADIIKGANVIIYKEKIEEAKNQTDNMLLLYYLGNLKHCLEEYYLNNQTNEIINKHFLVN